MRITTNIIWNFFGTCLPLLGGVVAVPHLIKALGTEKFGILSFSWLIVGYLSFFDFGLGRAITQVIGQKIGSGNTSEIPPLVRGGMGLMLILGVCGGMLMAGFSPWIVGSKLSISENLRHETLISFFFLSFSIPIVIISSGFRGILEGWQRFDVVNIIRAPLGLFTYFGPLLILPHSDALTAIVGFLVIGRVISCLAYGSACFYLYPELAKNSAIDIKKLREILSFGAWVTLSNITGPLLLYLGRFSLAFLASMEAVAYFSTSYDIVINMLVITGVFVGVLFPMFSQGFSKHVKLVRALYIKWMWYNLFIMLPLCLLSCVFAKPALELWVGELFAEKSYFVAQVLLVGIFINSFGHLAQTLVQAYGRPDLTAKLHVIELILYVPYMWGLVSYFGAEGAAISWLIRVTISTFVLGLMAQGCISGFIKKQTSWEV